MKCDLFYLALWMSKSGVEIERFGTRCPPPYGGTHPSLPPRPQPGYSLKELGGLEGEEESWQSDPVTASLWACAEHELGII